MDSTSWRSPRGCTNCRVTRIKCGRQKPLCKSCIHRGLKCDYSRQLKWFHSEEVQEGHDFVAPKLSKRRKASGEGEEEQAGDETVAGDLVVKQYFVGGAERDSSHGSASSGVSDVSDSKSDSSSSEFSPETDESYSTDVVDIIIPHEQFVDLSPLATASGHNRLLSKILCEDPRLREAFDHYLAFTCSSIDPINGSNSTNVSKTMYLPLALQSQACLYGILSLSAFQLSFTHSEYKTLGLQNRILSYRNLSNAVARANNTWNLDIMGSILVHLTIDVLEPVSRGWVTHLKLFRALFENTPLLNWHEHGILAWYISSRFVKYDTFACLQTGTKPLITWAQFDTDEMVDDDKLNASWSCPARLVVFCAEMAHAYISNGPIDVVYFYSVIIQLERMVAASTDTSPWEFASVYWMLGAILYFNRTMAPFNSEANNIVVNVASKMVSILQNFPKGSFMVTAIVWPTWLLVSVVTRPSDRENLADFLGKSAKEVRVVTFQIIKELAEQYWNQPDLSHEQYLRFTDRFDWNQLMA